MPEQHMDVDFPRTAQVQVYFTVGTRYETAIFRSDIPTEELKDLFRSAAEAGPHDVVKLYSRTGQLLNISADLEANTPETRYSLQVVAADGLASGMLREETCLQLKALEERITEIERQLKNDLPLPVAVQQLQQQVDGIRQKLDIREPP
ncbi:uncharacterized protein LOC112904555 [Agrilus planipennis]|uniref:Uncharacterized protein LOC112904555 n=1 Tax=Agrilus planipennis TaxID=224129 RepID=A0A7F5QZ44_AGRPL|nr:uncharacterized protein LOC112904555 [Agrilus planipennis]